MSESDLTSETLVSTSKPSPYLKQLCRHFGHRVEVSFDDDQGDRVRVRPL